MFRSENRSAKKRLAKRRNKLNRRKNRRHLQMESLEDRRLLTSDLPGTSGDDIFTLTYDSQSDQVHIEVDVTSGLGAFQGTPAQFASSGGIRALGLGGNDTFIVDLSTGDPIAALAGAGTTFEIVGGADADELVVNGGTVDVVYNATGAGAGALSLDGGTPALIFSELEPIVVTSAVASVVVNDLFGASDVNLTSPAAGTNLLSFSDGLESIEFGNPSAEFILNIPGTSDNNITIDIDPSFQSPIFEISPDSGNDTINLDAALGVNVRLGLFGGGAGDTIRIGNGDLSKIGDVLISTAGPTQQFIIDNSASTADPTWALSPGSYNVGMTARIRSGSPIGNLTVIGGDGDDSFVLSNPSFISPNINVVGNGQNSPSGDSITLIGNAVESIEHIFQDNSSGDINLGGTAITYTGLEPILDNLSATNRVFTFTQTSADISLTQSTTNAANTVLDSGVNESVEFAGASSSVTINLANGGNNTFTANSFGTSYSPFTAVNGGDQVDTFNVEATPPNGLRFFGGNGNDVLNVSPVARDLDEMTAFLDFIGDGGSDTVNVFDNNETAGRTIEVSNAGIDAGPVFGSGLLTLIANENVNVHAGSGNDTIDIQFTEPGVAYTFNGNGGDDAFLMNTAANLGSDVTINGGAGTGDRAEIGGDTVVTVTHTFANDNDGTIHLSDNNRTITYTGLSPILDNLNTNSRVFTFLSNTTDAEFTQSTTNPATHTVLDSSVNESVEFTTPTLTMTVNLANGGTNIITATSFASDFSPTTNISTINGGDQRDIINLEDNPANNAPVDWVINGNAGDDDLNISPVGRNLNPFGDDIVFNGGAGANDRLWVFDNNFAGGRTFDVTATSVNATGIFGVGDIDYFDTERLIIDAGTGNDTINILSTHPNVTNENLFRGWDGDDVFNIPDGSTLGSVVNIGGGNNDDRVNATLPNATGFASIVEVTGGADDDRDSIVVDDQANVARSAFIKGQGGSLVSLFGFGSRLSAFSNETIIVNGDATLDQVDIEGLSVSDDDITIVPGLSSAQFFFDGSPWSGPSDGLFTDNLPGVAGGGIRSDVIMRGIDDIDARRIVGPTPTNDRVFVYAPGEADLRDPNSNIDDFGFGSQVIIPGLGTGNAFDDVNISDTGVEITNNFLGALLRVDVVAAEFAQNNTDRAAIIVNTGAEAGTRPNGIADDITIIPSTILKLAANGQEPVQPTAPPEPVPTLDGLPNYFQQHNQGNAPQFWSERGDRLQMNVPGELNIYSDLSNLPQVSATSSIGGTPVLGVEFSSIESVLFRPNPTKPFVNLIGDDNGAAVQNDEFIVVGTDADQDGSDGGFREFKLMINGSSPINVDGARTLNVLGDDGADTFEVSPYADNTPLGWGIDVTFDEGSTTQPLDLFIYNTAFYGPNVSENIIVAPSGVQHGQVRVTNASFGTPIVNINYVNNLDIIVNDNDLSLSDTDTLTLLGTTADNPATSGSEQFDINFGAAGNVANPLVTVTNLGVVNTLYRLRNLQNVSAVKFDGLSGRDPFNVTAAAGVTVNIDGGNPNGNGSGDSLNVITGANTITHTAGDETDEGTFQIGGGAAPINYDEIELLLANGVAYTAADAFEANNTIATATFLGSVPEVTLNNLTLHGTNGVANPTGGSTSADFDVYEWVANKTGLATVTIDFTHANGDLRLAIGDSAGLTVVAVPDSVTDDETITFQVVAGQSYFVGVISATAAPNDYSLEIENFGAPVPASIDLQPANDTGSYDTDDITFDNVGTIEIQADLEAYRLAGVTRLTPAQAAAGNVAGVAVRVMVNGTEVGFATPTAPAAGGQLDDLFRYTFAAADLPNDDVFEVEAAVFVVDGQSANASGRALTGKVLLLELDRTAPVVGTIALAHYSDSGVLGDNITNKMSPAFVGVGEANAIVRVFGARINQAAPTNAPQILGVGRVGSDLTDGILGNGLGLWEITAEPMVNDRYQITYQMEDIAGNITNGPANAFFITVDALPPQRPTLDLVAVDVVDSMPNPAGVLTAPVYSDTGWSTTDNITRGTTPGGATSTVQMRVSAEIGQTVVIKDGEQIILTFTMPNSPFVFVNLNLDEDPHPLSAEVTDIAGNRSHQSEEVHLIMDYTAPLIANSTIDLANGTDSFGPDAGAIGNNTDNNTNDDTPLFVGVAEANAKIRMFANNELVGETTVNSDESDSDAPQNLLLGTWEIETASLIDGNYNITYEIEDAAGNISALSAPLAIVIDTLAPQRPTIDLHNVDDTGASDLDNVTAGDPTAAGRIVDYRISAETGSWVQVKDGETIIRTLVFTAAFDAADGLADGFGNITVDFDTLQIANNIPAEGPHIISVEAFDIPGNRSAQAEELVTEIDTIAPATPAAPNLDDDADSGMFNNDNVTNVTTPTFNGVGEANSLIRLFAVNINGGVIQQIAEGRVGSDESDGTDTNGVGVWSLQSIELDEGVYDITATFEDLAGNISVTTAALRIEIDSVQPNTAFLDLREADDSGRHNDDNITNVTTPIFTATTEDPNDTIHILPANLKYRIFDRPEGSVETLIYDSNVTLAGLTALELVTTPGLLLSEGYHNLKLEVEDRAGNISEDFLLTVVIDTVAPPVNIIGLLDSDSGITINQASLTDRVTNRTDADFVGRAEADSIVRLYVDGREGVNNDNNAINNAGEFSLTVAQPFDGDDAFPNGQWETTFIRDLNDGNFFDLDGVREVLATAEDVAGNVTPVPAVLDIFIDTQGPRITSVQLPVNTSYDLFDPKPSTDGPTPRTNQISISVSDLPLRSNQDGNFLYDALYEAIAENPGNYSVVGDATGNAGIQSVVFTHPAGADQTLATGLITITFADFLADDRFTLVVSDALLDPAGNALDGETNTTGPLEVPTFPTGDGQAGGSFNARFTIDTRPEVGNWAGGTVWVDTNGNASYDPTNADHTNRDITYVMGLVTDNIFAGNFALNAGDTADGFDKIAAYGSVNGAFRWLVDTDNDGRANAPLNGLVDPAGVNGVPVAGRFDANDNNGDEVAVFTGTQWVFDTNHDYNLDTTLNTAQRGLPIVGDFDGDGFDDLGTWTDDTFQFDLANGVRGGWDGVVDQSFRFGFIGTREVPVAADMNMDGIDDVGLWVPDREGQTPREGGEYYFLVSNGGPVASRIRLDAQLGTNVVDFHPTPFGQDFVIQFGDDYARPLVGNFDPPVTSNGQPLVGSLNFNTKNPFDVNGDDRVSSRDVIDLILHMRRHGTGVLQTGTTKPLWVDVNQDGELRTSDISALVQAVLLNYGGNAEPTDELVDIFFTDLEEEDDNVLLLDLNF